jgi:disease resistance protein RPM1
MEGLLPSSVGMLTQLVCLHAPWMELPGGIIKDLTSLQELQIYEVEDKSVGQFVKELSNLSELRLLRTDISGRMDERMQSDLLTSLGNLHKLQRLDLVGMLLPRDGFTFHWLPSCIHPSHLPNLSDLSLAVHSLGDQAMEILGGLPELCHLYLLTKGRATLTGTAGRGYFQKLQSFLLIESTAYFVVNEDSSVSLTIWHARRRNDAPAFAPRREQDTCRVAGAIMPNLQALLFEVDVAELTACNNGRCDNLGLEYLPSLQKVFVHLYRRGADADVLEKENAALRHAIQVHPNRPTLKIK